MNIFVFDNTFEGLLTSVFEAYSRRVFPDALSPEGEPLPLFYDEVFTVITEEEKAKRVWRGCKRNSLPVLCLASPNVGWRRNRKLRCFCFAIFVRRLMLLVPLKPILPIRMYWNSRVCGSGWIGNVFVCSSLSVFRKLPTAPSCCGRAGKNALPLAIDHFKDRFADQPWLIYDIKRAYGFYYDLKEVRQVTFEEGSCERHLVTGMLDESLMDKDEKLFQQLWKTYFKAICIKERLNPRKHKQDMPIRYWKHMTEKQ